MSDAAETAEMPQLAFERKGQGHALVLVHGYLGGSAMWRRQLDTLSPEFDVIAPELSGYGSSFAERAESSIKGYAQQILDVLDHLGIHRFHLLGHSMGGMIVQQLTAMAPERITKLICYGTGPQGVLPDRFETIEQSRSRLNSEGVAPTARRIAATWFAAGENARDYADCAALGERVTTESALAGLTAMETWDGRAALNTMTQPTLIIWGDKDRSYGWQQPEALWRGIPNSSLAVMPGCGHNAHLENPALFNAIIRDFLTDAAQNAAPLGVEFNHNENQSSDKRN